MNYFVADVEDSKGKLVKRYLYGVAISELYKFNKDGRIMSQNGHIKYIKSYVKKNIKLIPHPDNCKLVIRVMSYKNIIKYKIPFQVFDPPWFNYKEIEAFPVGK